MNIYFSGALLDLFFSLLHHVSPAPGRMLRISKLGQDCEAGRLFPPEYYLIGDSGYSIETWLMVPYPIRVGMTDTEHLYNYKLSGTRMIVECAFGRLKGRWRILNAIQQASLKHATRVSLACAILHNLCSRSADSAYRASWNVAVPRSSVGHRAGGENEATRRRDDIAESLWQRYS